MRVRAPSRSPARGRRALPLRRGYSLAALFLLMAAIAVLAAMASSLPSFSKIPEEVALPNLIVGLLGGALIGGTIGIHYERRIRATAVGVAVGAATGVTGGMLTFSEFNPLMAFIQSGVLVALAIVVRLTTPTRPRLRRVPAPATMPEAVPQDLRTRLAHASRAKLLAAGLMALCTALALMNLASKLERLDLSTSRGWMEATAGLIVALASLAIGIYLLSSALRSAARPTPPSARQSPWD